MSWVNRARGIVCDLKSSTVRQRAWGAGFEFRLETLALWPSFTCVFYHHMHVTMCLVVPLISCAQCASQADKIYVLILTRRMQRRARWLDRARHTGWKGGAWFSCESWTGFNQDLNKNKNKLSWVTHDLKKCFKLRTVIDQGNQSVRIVRT